MTDRRVVIQSRDVKEAMVALLPKNGKQQRPRAECSQKMMQQQMRRDFASSCLHFQEVFLLGEVGAGQEPLLLEKEKAAKKKALL